MDTTNEMSTRDCIVENYESCNNTLTTVEEVINLIGTTLPQRNVHKIMKELFDRKRVIGDRSKVYKYFCRVKQSQKVDTKEKIIIRPFKMCDQYMCVNLKNGWYILLERQYSTERINHILMKGKRYQAVGFYNIKNLENHFTTVIPDCCENHFVWKKLKPMYFPPKPRVILENEDDEIHDLVSENRNKIFFTEDDFNENKKITEEKVKYQKTLESNFNDYYETIIEEMRRYNIDPYNENAMRTLEEYKRDKLNAFLSSRPVETEEKVETVDMNELNDQINKLATRNKERWKEVSMIKRYNKGTLQTILHENHGFSLDDMVTMNKAELQRLLIEKMK